MKLKKICINKEYSQIYISDEKGNIIVLDLNSAKYIHRFKVCSYKIKNMCVCLNGKYLAVIIQTGLSFLIEINEKFKVVLKLEDHTLDKQNKFFKSKKKKNIK